jgi:hypothetical protein
MQIRQACSLAAATAVALFTIAGLADEKAPPAAVPPQTAKVRVRPPTANDLRARELEDQATKSFVAKHFAQAAKEYQQAAELGRHRDLYWNIGDAWDRAGEGEKAVAAYKTYIQAYPNDHVVPDVQKRIKEIEALHFKLRDQSAPAATKSVGGDAPARR